MRDEAYPDEDSPRGDPAATPRRYGRVTTHLIGSHHARIRWSGWQLRLRRAIAFNWSWSWPGVERSAANRRVVRTVEGVPPEAVAATLRNEQLEEAVRALRRIAFYPHGPTALSAIAVTEIALDALHGLGFMNIAACDLDSEGRPHGF